MALTELCNQYNFEISRTFDLQNILDSFSFI